MDASAMDKLTRRARKALRHASRQALVATTEKARKRHERRQSCALRNLRDLAYDSRRHGLAFTDG